MNLAHPVCGAADTLTALGVRVQVFSPAIPWPRTGRFVISDHVGRLGDLAVSTAIRGATDDGTVICPVSVRYRVTYPSPEAASAPNNRAFLRETGGLLDGPATYLYLAEHKLAPAHVTFALPADWRIATGLVPTADSRTFFAPSYDVLADSPVLVGVLRSWTFEAAGAPVRIAYWPLPDAAPFDTAAFPSLCTWSISFSAFLRS